MLQRHLRNLNHPAPAVVDIHDVQHLRKLVVWLECNHIKNGINGLDDTYAVNWNDLFSRYLNGLNFPAEWFQQSAEPQVDSASWLVGQAIRSAYRQNAKQLNDESSAAMISSVAIVDQPPEAKRVKVSNFQEEDFKEGVRRIAALLKVPNVHPDHLVTLEACCKLIKTRLNHKCLSNPGKVVPRGESFELKDHDVGVPGCVADPVLREAMKILRLTHLQHLRDLQSEINATIETVQAATADPKTDTKIGKVGR